METVILPVLSTSQPLGGVRRWWQCPNCGRRCRILPIAGMGPPACRRCWGAVYSADYPQRHFWRQFVIFFHGMAEGLWSVSPERDRELGRLLAKRRRGVRRGRRVRVRGLRQLDRLRQEPDRVTSLLSDYWKQP